jgi:hypothetical protein
MRKLWPVLCVAIAFAMPGSAHAKGGVYHTSGPIPLSSLEAAKKPANAATRRHHRRCVAGLRSCRRSVVH